MKQYNVGDVVQFLGDEYKVVEVLDQGDSLHIKKTSAPGNSMVVPLVKLENSQASEKILEDLGHKLPDVDKVFDPLEGYDDQEVPDFEDVTNTLDFSVKPDLLYRPDDSIVLTAGASVPSVQDIFSEDQMKATQGSLMGY